MKRFLLGLPALFVFLIANPAKAQTVTGPFRPPAVPLVTHDPYFSIWSMSDKLTDDWPKHWTGATHALAGLIRIDGKAYRFMGKEPGKTPALEQKSVIVNPLTTIYEFSGEGVDLKVTFLSPLIPSNLELMSRPVTYVTFAASSADGAEHDVQLYFDMCSEIAVNNEHQEVLWTRAKLGEHTALRFGSKDQPVLQKSGDNLRIDWGHLYMVLPPSTPSNTVFAASRVSREKFTADGELLPTDDLDMPRSVASGYPVAAAHLKLGKVSANPVEATALLVYDDQYSIEYLGRRCRPYWRKDGSGVARLVASAIAEFEDIRKQASEFDQELTKELKSLGGDSYAAIGSIAFRQCVAAHKLVADFDGTPMFFSKENFSNGCIATVDVTYPSSPFFLLFNPELLKAQVYPVLEYAASSRWKFPFAPHDLGTYPLANGQRYGGGEKTEDDQMPVEESGNMLIIMAALAHIEGNADFASKYWPILTDWANYLSDKGLDPENQLSTDDFAGKLAHNTNLSLKAITGIACYGRLAASLGKTAEAEKFTNRAKEMAATWIADARDGDHYKLTFDKPGTWSQKYNLAWDKVLGLDLFPADVAAAEVAHYLKSQNKYGLPLDSRMTYTKNDWILWCASLTENPADFKALVDPVYLFLHETPDRVPMTDWYETSNAKKVGFQARSVVGGVYMPLLKNPEVWKKWAGK